MNKFLKKAQKADTSSTKKGRGLGRGLDGLLTAPSAEAGTPVLSKPIPAIGGTPLELKIAEIERSPYQPRREFRQEELQELSESIKNNGLIQPPTVRKNERGRYELICGERRLRAAQMIGWDKIRVTLVDADEQTAAVMTTTENLQREDLNPIEEAESYRNLQEQFNLTQADVAEKVGKGRATVANSVRLLELPEEVRGLVERRVLSVGHAKLLLALESEKDRIIFAREVVDQKISVRALEKKIERLKMPVPEKKTGTPDIPEGYVRSLTDKLKRHLGCAVRLTSGVTHQNGKHTKGVLEIDFFDNDDLDRIIRMIGLDVN